MTHKASSRGARLVDGDENVIVDFKYSNSPRYLVVRPHQSAFLTPADAEQFRKAPGKHFFYEPAYKSCTMLIADTAEKNLDLIRSRWRT